MATSSVGFSSINVHKCYLRCTLRQMSVRFITGLWMATDPPLAHDPDPAVTAPGRRWPLVTTDMAMSLPTPVAQRKSHGTDGLATSAARKGANPSQVAPQSGRGMDASGVLRALTGPRVRRHLSKSQLA